MSSAGQWPRLSYSNTAFVLARSTATGEVLLGGLGAMGVGRMWIPETDAHKNYQGYSQAPDAPKTALS